MTKQQSVCMVVVGMALWTLANGAPRIPAETIHAHIESVHDGDTLAVSLPCGIPVACAHISVRVKDIDTPELSDKRPEMRAIAIRARDMARASCANGVPVILDNPSRDKYYRINARVLCAGIDLGQALIDHGLAKKYTGHGQKPW